MLTNVFENRNRYFTNLLKLGDFLGRSLRENVELFSVDGNEITFITENNKVIKGNFELNKPNLLQNIKVEDTSIFENKEKFSKIVDKRVSTFLSDIIENDLISAENTFDEVLKLWELRLQFDVTKKKLTERSNRFKNSKITQTPEFARVIEMKQELINYLKQNSKIIGKLDEIKNSVKLTNVISKCFNLPKVTYEDLNESTYKVPGRVSQNLYEHLTKIELISKELNESKKEFNSIWSTNDLVVDLASMIYEQKENKIYESLAKVIHQVPYFALTTKKQLNETFRTVLNLLEQEFNDNDLKNFTSFIYESKKPVKNYIISLLNEKYGINITNLKEVPTFSTLAETEQFIFEALSRLSPKNSNLKRVLSEMANVLKNKNGIETIDIADFLNEVFNKANYTKFINETTLLNYLDFNRVADDLGKIGSVLKMIQQGVAQQPMGGGMGGGGPLDAIANSLHGMKQSPMQTQPEDQYGDESGADMPPPEEAMGEEQPMEGGDEGMEDMEQAPEDMPPEEGMEGMEGGPEGMEQAPEGEAMPEEMPPEEGMEGMEGGEDMTAPPMDSGPEMEEPSEMGEEDLISNLKELESMISQLKADMGIPGSNEAEGGAEAFGGEESPEEEALEHEGMNNEEGDENGDGESGDVNIDIDTSDDDGDAQSDDDEVHIDLDSHKDNEGEEEEEEEEDGEEEEEYQEEDDDEEDMSKQEEAKELVGNQDKLDADGSGDLTGKDFALLRKKGKHSNLRNKLKFRHKGKK